MKYYMGIDPGVNGGVVIISGEKKICAIQSFRDKTLPEVIVVFDKYFENDMELVILLERVHAMPSRFRGCSTSWTLAESFSALKTILTISKRAYDVVLPDKWQSVLGLQVKKSKKKVDKKKLNREKAFRLFPRAVGFIDLDTADALLIAEYARRTYK